MASALSAILCLAIGCLSVMIAIGRGKFEVSSVLFRLSLAGGFGIGVLSIIYFLCRVWGVLALWQIEVATAALLFATFLVVARASSAFPLRTADARGTMPRSLSAGFVLGLAAAVYAAIVRALQRPYGNGWDSFAIWNLHARFLYRGGAYWREGFSPLIPWSHPDYPLLVPAAIAHFWTTLGHESTSVPTVIGLIFLFLTAGLLFSALDLLQGRISAMLGAMSLLCTPFFVDLGTWQYADVPLSFYILATIVMFQMHDVGGEHDGSGALALAGLAGGFAAWTKNEGVLFLCAILMARMLAGFRRPRVPRQAGAFQTLPLLFTVVPVFCVLAYFKRSIAPPGDLFSTPASMLQKMSDPSRYWAVIKWYGREIIGFGHWLIPIPLLMLGLYLLLRREKRTQSQYKIAGSIWALGLTLVGYFVIYLITPHEIYWHLRFSLNRLFAQLWPSAIFLFLLKLNVEELYSVQGSA